MDSVEDDILTHLTVTGETFGVPVWNDLMDEAAAMLPTVDAAVALRHPDGRPMLRHIVAVEDCRRICWRSRPKSRRRDVQHRHGRGVNYVDAAQYAARAWELGRSIGGSVGRLLQRHQQARWQQLPAEIRHLYANCSAVAFTKSGQVRRERSGFKGRKDMRHEDKVILIWQNFRIGEALPSCLPGTGEGRRHVEPGAGGRRQAARRAILPVFYGDMSNEADVKAAVELALRQFGRLDCVHQRRHPAQQKITDITVEGFHPYQLLNLLGPAWWPSMRFRHGTAGG